MPIPFECPNCQRQTLVDDKFAGKRGECAGCGAAIEVPDALTTGSVVPSGRKQISAGAPASLILGCGLLLLFVLLLVSYGASIFWRIW